MHHMILFASLLHTQLYGFWDVDFHIIYTHIDKSAIPSPHTHTLTYFLCGTQICIRAQRTQ